MTYIWDWQVIRLLAKEYMIIRPHLQMFLLHCILVRLLPNCSLGFAQKKMKRKLQKLQFQPPDSLKTPSISTTLWQFNIAMENGN